MLGIAAAFVNPQAGPISNTNTLSSNTLTKVRTPNTVALITSADKLFFFPVINIGNVRGINI